MFKKSVVAVLLTVVLLTNTACLKKDSDNPQVSTQKVELVYYKLYDNDEVIRPIIQQYQALNPNVVIKYRKFDNPADYYATILNEMAEGEGPDLLSVPNYWIARNSKKITPLSTQVFSPQQFEETFVAVAAKDAIQTDTQDGARKVFGLPLGVDTLALYYNKELYEDRVPSRGKPGTTWEEFKDDVFRLTKADNSFERFELAGTAMGRSDNILRAMDILLSIMLQYKVDFYNANFTQAVFANQSSTDTKGLAVNPATEALKLYTSFALASQKNYSWNDVIADANSSTKELTTFASGKVASIFGYSFTYQQILDEIKQLKNKNQKTINPESVRTALIPQVNDPAVSTEKRDVLANYFLETVSRNCDNPDVAWDFLLFLTAKENASFYHEKTKRPTARRDLIEDQKKDPIYGVFAEQVGFAESFPIYDYDLYQDLFYQAINAVLATKSPRDALRQVQDGINKSMPTAGIYPALDLDLIKAATNTANNVK